MISYLMATHGEKAIAAAESNAGMYKTCPKCGKPIGSPMLHLNCKCKRTTDSSQ